MYLYTFTDFYSLKVGKSMAAKANILMAFTAIGCKNKIYSCKNSVKVDNARIKTVKVGKCGESQLKLCQYKDTKSGKGKKPIHNW
jgi:hypothetical protein